EWLTTIGSQTTDAVPKQLPAVGTAMLKSREARRYISRSPSESSWRRVIGCGMQLPPLQASAKLNTEISGITCAKVALAGAKNFGATLYMRKLLVVLKLKK